MTTLKTAQRFGNLSQFIAEREDASPGDMDAFARCFTSMVQTKKAAPVA